jgi:hypothetical protein
MLLNELRALITRHAREDETTAIDGVLVSVAAEPAAPTASTSGTVLALIAQGAKRLVLGDRVLDYRAGQYLVASVDLPVTGQFTEASPTEPALGFGLTLRPSVIAELLLDPAAGPVPTRPPRRRGPAGYRGQQRFVRAHRRRAHVAAARSTA